MTDVFRTQELAIWDDDRLVGLSLFDLGKRSLQSLAGIFDPEYAEHSIGFYSLLLEIRHAARRYLLRLYHARFLTEDAVRRSCDQLGANVETEDFERTAAMRDGAESQG